VSQPVEGDDAGPAQEYWANRKRQRIQSSHSRAEALASGARVALMFSPKETAGRAREGLQVAAETYWFAEETEFAAAEHQYLQEIGRWTRENVGCQFDCENGRYSTSCPVKLADKRFGVSAGVIATVVCSQCGDHLDECLHRTDRMYWARGGSTEFGPCRVCGRAKCEHSPEKLHQAPVVGIMKNCQLEEASLSMFQRTHWRGQ
jgi:hypothetical protein